MFVTANALGVVVGVGGRVQVLLTPEQAVTLADKTCMLVSAPLVYATRWRVRGARPGDWTRVDGEGRSTVRLSAGTGDGTETSQSAHEIVQGRELSDLLRAAAREAQGAAQPDAPEGRPL